MSPSRQGAGLTHAACQRWPSPDAYWTEQLDHATLQRLARKYGSLLHWIGQAASPTRDAGLRALAAEFRGALREGQLADLERLHARLHAVTAALAFPPRSRGEFPLPAIPLWADLHDLLGDVARIRKVGPARAVHELGEVATRWPSGGPWWSTLTWPLDARTARVYLAGIAGYDLAELDDVLTR